MRDTMSSAVDFNPFSLHHPRLPFPKLLDVTSHQDVHSAPVVKPDQEAFATALLSGDSSSAALKTPPRKRKEVSPPSSPQTPNRTVTSSHAHGTPPQTPPQTPPVTRVSSAHPSPSVVLSPMKYHYALEQAKNRDLRKFSDKPVYTVCPFTVQRQSKVIQRYYADIRNAKEYLRQTGMERITFMRDGARITVYNDGKTFRVVEKLVDGVRDRTFGTHVTKDSSGAPRARLYPKSGTKMFPLTGQEALDLLHQHRKTPSPPAFHEFVEQSLANPSGDKE